MFYDLLNMTTTYIQYLSLLIRISPESFPAYYSKPFHVVRYFVFDLLQSSSEDHRYDNPLNVVLPSWLPLDARLNFFFVVTVAPLAICTLALLGVYSKLGYLWCISSLAGLFMFVFGAVLLAEPHLTALTASPPRVTQVVLVAVGVPLFSGLLVGGTVVMRYNRRRKTQKEAAALAMYAREEQQRQAEYPMLHRLIDREGLSVELLAAERVRAERRARSVEYLDVADAAMQVTFVVVMFLGSLVFLGAIPISEMHDLQASKLFRGFGGALLGITVLYGIWVALVFSRRGRAARASFTKVVSSKFLSLMLSVISFFYTTVVTHFVSVLYCAELVCDAGTRPPDAASLLPHLNTSDRANSHHFGTILVGCVTCDFERYPQHCPASWQNTLCSSVTEQSRLVYDPRVRCSDVGGFYKTAASLMFVVYVLLLPYLQAVLGGFAVRVLREEYPLERRFLDIFTERELYIEKVQTSRNNAASVYRAYKPGFHFYRLTMVLEKIVLAVISCVTRRGLQHDWTWIGLMFFLIIPLVSAGCAIGLRPFIRPSEAIYYPALHIMVAITSVVGLGGQQHGGDRIPYAVGVILMVMLVLVPLLTLIVATILTLRNERHRNTLLQQRLASGFNSGVLHDQSTTIMGATWSRLQEEAEERSREWASDGRSMDSRPELQPPLRHSRSSRSSNANSSGSDSGDSDYSMDDHESGSLSTLDARVQRRSTDGDSPLHACWATVRRLALRAVQAIKTSYEDFFGMTAVQINTTASVVDSDREMSSTARRGPASHDPPLLSVPATHLDHEGFRSTRSHSESGSSSSSTDSDDDRAASSRSTSFERSSSSLHRARTNMNGTSINKGGDDDDRISRRSRAVVSFCDNDVYLSDNSTSQATKQLSSSGSGTSKPAGRAQHKKKKPSQKKKKHDGAARGSDGAGKTNKGATPVKRTLARNPEYPTEGYAFIPRMYFDAGLYRSCTYHGAAEGTTDNEGSSITESDSDVRSDSEEDPHTPSYRSLNLLTRYSTLTGSWRSRQTLRRPRDRGPWSSIKSRLQRAWVYARNRLLLADDDLLKGKHSLLTFDEVQSWRHEAGEVRSALRAASGHISGFQRPHWGVISDAMLGAVEVPGSTPPWFLHCTTAHASTQRTPQGEPSAFAAIAEAQDESQRRAAERRKVVREASAEATDTAASADPFLRIAFLAAGNQQAEQRVAACLAAARRRLEAQRTWWTDHGYRAPVAGALSADEVAQPEMEKSLFGISAAHAAASFTSPQRQEPSGPTAPRVLQTLLLEVAHNVTHAVGTQGGAAALPIAASPTTASPLIGAKDFHEAVVESSEANTEMDFLALMAAPSSASAACGGDGVDALVMSQLRDHFFLRNHLKQAYLDHKERLHAVQRAIDQRIVKVARRVMTVTFIAVSVIACLSMTLTFAGMLDTMRGDFISGVRHDDRSVHYELAGYSSWEEFTSHCCCTASTDVSAKFPAYALEVEDWMCENGLTKERIRRDGFEKDVYDGYAVRPLCGMQFKNNCALQVENNKVAIVNCSDVVTERERKRW